MFPTAAPPKPVLSPCTGVCRLDDAGYCEGCHRSGAEIAHWLQFTDAQRRHLMHVVLPQRATAKWESA